MYQINMVWYIMIQPSIHFSSVPQSCQTLCIPRLQHARPPCPSPLLEFTQTHVMGRWCHPTISSSVVPFSSRPQSFPASGSNESVFCIRRPKYWSFSFSISPSKEYSGLISFRMDWLDLLAVQRTLKSLLQHHSSKASILWHFDKSSVSSLKLSLY